ncbi:uracil-DNA glycosylase 2 [Polaribacter pacificus]|uniref:Uracil-DNA glycosylase n=1 Tax=Polaribacter pacificus TaxID=1775173 RepID=A0A917I1F0_9FLAO|nr:uracil-DNA glycosylase [Polaribacter pacificus]GGH03413.1 uracil-DNA glycosylase 2 [Polaribacter pacificus]
MEVNMPESWKNVLEKEFTQDYFKDLISFVDSEYDLGVCYPPKDQIFAAFSACDFTDVKVVIIGQDPYHGPKQANGLCFSVTDDVSHPPSLQNIFKELSQEYPEREPSSGDLSNWAKQGVFLLNATLTVRAHQAGSHQKKGWEQFTSAVIDALSTHRKELVFLLWGGFAKQKGKNIDAQKHAVFTSGHPSPLSANRGYWFGNQHFLKANAYLENVGKESIDW